MNTILRNPWPYVISAWFAVFILGIIAWVSFAMRQSVDLVGADYYEQEVTYQRQIDRLNRTQPIDAQPAIGYDAAQGVITIALPGGQAQRTTGGNIHLYRPSDAQLDHKLALAPDSQGRQILDARKLLPGLWKVRVIWTVDGQEYFFDQSVVVGSHKS